SPIAMTHPVRNEKRYLCKQAQCDAGRLAPPPPGMRGWRAAVGWVCCPDKLANCGRTIAQLPLAPVPSPRFPSPLYAQKNAPALTSGARRWLSEHRNDLPMAKIRPGVDQMRSMPMLDRKSVV